MSGISKDIEAHADLEHEIWSSWMRYMFSKGRFNNDGSWSMPAELVVRWSRQMRTPYSKLSEKEKMGDIEQVNKHWDLIKGKPINRKGGTEI